MAEFLLRVPHRAALIAFIWLMYSVIRNSRRVDHGRKTIIIFAISFLASALIFYNSPPGFRVLSDETDFINTARAITHGQSSGVQEWGLSSGGKLVPLQSFPTFRPLMFPSLISIISEQWIEPSVPFFLNFIFLGLFLFLIARLIARGKGILEALAVVVVFSLLPQLRLSATSGGYDLLALLFGLVTVRTFQDYSHTRTRALLRVLIASVVCFASTRYEGLLAALVVAGAFLRWKTFSWEWLLGGILMVPPLVQRLYFPGHVDVPNGEALFSLSRIPSQLWGFLAEFFGPSSILYPSPLHWVGLGMIGFAIWKRKISNWWPAVFFTAYFLFLLGFHAGQAGDSFQARLFLPFSCALLYFACGAIGQNGSASRFWIGVAFIVFAGMLLPKGPEPLAHPMVEEMRSLREVVDKASADTIFVYANPGQISALGHAAIQPWRYLRDTKLMEQNAKKVVWVEALPAVTPGQVHPDWIDEAHLVRTEELGRLRSLRFYEKSLPEAKN